MAEVLAVALSAVHSFSKTPQREIRLLSGLGVEGDAHAGGRVRHRSRVRADAEQPNLRQVHLIQAELLDDLAARGFAVAPGQLGENLSTRGIDLLALGRGTRLRLGAEAEVEISGLRNPCQQLDDFLPGLQAAVLERAADGSLVRKAGVMAIVLRDGVVRPGDPIEVIPPEGPHEPLAPV
ncbi:MAG: MOSC domain-containing protein [Planctomycetes bacterium]|nr:MOSC domain-containing protein [Planctomycetota bacterium]